METQPYSTMLMNIKAGLSVHKCICMWRFVNQIKNFSRTESQAQEPGARFSKNLRKNPKFSVSFS